MAVENTDKVIIEVDLQADDALTQATRLGGSIKSLTEQQKALRAANKQTDVTFQSNAQVLRNLQREQRAYITLASAEKGSNVQLRASLSLLNQQYDALSRSERDNTTAGKALELQIAAINAELTQSEGATGRFQRNVGNYASGLGNTVSGLTGLGSLPGIQAITPVLEAIRNTVTLTTVAIRDQQVAQELLAAASLRSTEALAAQTTATEATNAASLALSNSEAALAEVESARVAVAEGLVSVTSLRLEQEEAEILILSQLAREQAVIIAEENARIAEEQALVAVQAEVTAAEQVRVAVELELTAAMASEAAATAGATSATTAFGTALAATGIGAIIVLVGSLITYLKDLDAVTDKTAQVFSGLKAGVGELGRSIIDLDFDGVTQRIQSVAVTAAAIKDQTQTLEDSMLAQSVKSASAQQQIAQKRVEAMNRTLDPSERKKLLADAERIDEDDLKRRQLLNDRALDQARISIALTGNLEKYQQENLKKRGTEYALYLQNNLTTTGKVTEDQVNQLAEAEKQKIQILGEYTQRAEKRNNLQDKIDQQAEKSAEKAAEQAKKRAEELSKIDDDRAKSLLTTAQLTLTTRQKEFEDINLDINKRIKVWEKYGQDTTQLELERQSRIAQLTKKFRDEDLKVIQSNVDEATNIRISLIKNAEERTSAQQQQANTVAIRQVDEQIQAIYDAFAMGDASRLAELQSFQDKRAALVEQGNAQRVDQAQTLQDRLSEIEAQGRIDSENFDREQLIFQQEQTDAREAMNLQLAGSFENLFGTIGDLAGKNTALSKIALVAQKAFAIAEILINSERAKAAVVLKYSLLEAQAAAIPIGGLLVIAGLEAAKYAELGAIATQEIISIGITAAQTIAGVAGMATGGLHYDSDGKGALLSGPGNGKSDSMNARLSNGEAVINAKSTAEYFPLLSAINQAGGGVAFANGGVYGGSFVSSLSARVNSENETNRQFMKAVQSINVYTLITDIRNENAKQNEIIAGSTF